MSDAPADTAAESVEPVRDTDDGAWMIVFEDADMLPEVFAGHGAGPAARKRYEQALSNWSVHLFERVSDGERGSTFRALAAERDEREDMANVGAALVDAIKSALDLPLMKGWSPADCPSEIVFDLINMVEEVGVERAAAIARAEAAEAERDALLAVARAAREVHEASSVPGSSEWRPITEALDCLPPGTLDRPA